MNVDFILFHSDYYSCFSHQSLLIDIIREMINSTCKGRFPSVSLIFEREHLPVCRV